MEIDIGPEHKGHDPRSDWEVLESIQRVLSRFNEPTYYDDMPIFIDRDDAYWSGVMDGKECLAETIKAIIAGRYRP